MTKKETKRIIEKLATLSEIEQEKQFDNLKRFLNAIT